MNSISRSVMPNGDRRLSMRGGWSPELQNALEEGWCNDIYVHAGQWGDFRFLEQFAASIYGLTIASPVDSLKGVESLVHLRRMTLEVAPNPPIDLTIYEFLESCELYWHKKYSPQFFALPQLKHLLLTHYTEKDCTHISQATGLTDLSFAGGSLQSLNGIELLGNLRRLELTRIGRLADISSVAVLTGLDAFHLERCSKVMDVDFVRSLCGLRELFLDCGGTGFTDIAWLARFGSLVDLLIAVPVHSINWDVIFELPMLQRVVLNSHPGYEIDNSALFKMAMDHGRALSNFVRAGTKKHPGFKFAMEPKSA